MTLKTKKHILNSKDPVFYHDWFNPIKAIQNFIKTSFYKDYLVNRFTDIIEALPEEGLDLNTHSFRRFLRFVETLEKEELQVDFGTGISDNGEVTIFYPRNDVYIIFSSDGNNYYSFGTSDFQKTSGCSLLVKKLGKYLNKLK